MEERFVRVNVVTDARRESISENERGGFEISVREPAAENRANARVRELIAARLRTPLSAVKIVAGHHSSRKTIRIVGG